MKYIFIYLIQFYQKYLSHKKGYQCAYAHYNNTKSCSQYVLDKTKKYGFISGIKAYNKRTKVCKKVYQKNNPHIEKYLNCDYFI